MKYFSLKMFYEDENAKINGINNRPSQKIMNNIKELTNNLLIPLRASWSSFCRKNKLGSPEWEIIAGYRCDEMNKFYEDKKSSSHLKGLAADFKLKNEEYELFLSFAENFLKSENINFDELIWEKKEHCIHLAIKNNEGKQRFHIKIKN